MNAIAELQANLTAIAERSAAIKSACLNEESTKQYLVLPVIGALEYDYTDPFEVQPEYAADFREGIQERVDYAIMQGGKPVIAIECKKVGTELSGNRGQLRAYFTALQSVRLGILTDGLRFEFFVDCENPNIMDSEPFVTLDLDAATSGAIPSDVLDALSLLTRSNFAPDAIAEAAEMRLVAKRVRTALMQEVREPSDEFCRLVLQRVGVKNVRRASLQSRYSSLIRAAFEDALVYLSLRSFAPRLPQKPRKTPMRQRHHSALLQPIGNSPFIATCAGAWLTCQMMNINSQPSSRFSIGIISANLPSTMEMSVRAGYSTLLKAAVATINLSFPSLSAK